MRGALVGVVLLTLAGPALAWETPARGTPLRTDLMDAIRPHAEWSLGAPVEFVVHELRVADDLAFAAVHAQRPGGGAIDLRQTPGYARGEIEPDFMDGSSMQALYQRAGDQWVAVLHALGATDVWFSDPALCPLWAPVLTEFCDK